MSAYSTHSAVSSTRLYLPGWWVKAFEAFAEAEFQNNSALEIISRSGILPVITGDELAILSLFVSNAQSQILNSQSSRFKILDSDISGESPFSGSAKIALVEKSLAQFPVLRILSGEGGAAWNISNKFRLGNDAQGRWIEIDATPEGQELILGYCHAHADFLRVAQNQHSLGKALGPYLPLCIWKSVWLDLDLNSQLIMMRIESAMQHEHQWVQLDGTAAINFEEVFRFVKFQVRKSNVTEFTRRRKLLESLGRKLIDHGVIDDGLLNHYYALVERDQIQLLFRSKEGLLANEHVHLYCDNVGKYFSKRQLGLKLIGKYAHEDLARWQTFYDSLPESDRELHIVSGNRIFVAFDFFAEITLRMQGVWTDGVHPSFDKFPVQLAQAWTVFLSHWQSFDFSQSIKEPYFSLASDASLADIQIMRLLSTNNLSQNENSLATVNVVAASQRVQPPLATRDHRARNVVSEELDRLKTRDKAQYKNLCDAYLSSLREEERRLFESIQKQMNPVVFETQLRARLIRFMIDNPGTWGTSKAGIGASE